MLPSAYGAFLFETDGFGRLDTADHEAGTHKCQGGERKGGSVEQEYYPGIEAHRHALHIIGGGVEFCEAPLLLRTHEAYTDEVANEQAFEGDEDCKMQEYVPNAAIGGSQCLEQSDGVGAFEYEDEKSAHHGETGYAYHQGKDDPYVPVEQAEP